MSAFPPEHNFEFAKNFSSRCCKIGGKGTGGNVGLPITLISNLRRCPTKPLFCRPSVQASGLDLRVDREKHENEPENILVLSCAFGIFAKGLELLC